MWNIKKKATCKTISLLVSCLWKITWYYIEINHYPQYNDLTENISSTNLLIPVGILFHYQLEKYMSNPIISFIFPIISFIFPYYFIYFQTWALGQVQYLQLLVTASGNYTEAKSRSRHPGGNLRQSCVLETGRDSGQLSKNI